MRVGEAVDAAIASGLQARHFGAAWIALERRRLISQLTEWLGHERRRTEPFEVIACEVPLRAQWDALPIHLRLDRADTVTTADGPQVLLIDYKTDRPAPASAEDVDASYLMQMAAYQIVLEQAWPGRTVRPSLLYTDGPKLFELQPSLLQNSRDRLAGGL